MKYLIGDFDELYNKYYEIELSYRKNYPNETYSRMIQNGIICIGDEHLSCSGNGYLIKNSVYTGLITDDNGFYGRYVRLDRLEDNDYFKNLCKNLPCSFFTCVGLLVNHNELNLFGETVIEIPVYNKNFNRNYDTFGDILKMSNENFLELSSLNNMDLIFVGNVDKFGQYRLFRKKEKQNEKNTQW